MRDYEPEPMSFDKMFKDAIGKGLIEVGYLASYGRVFHWSEAERRVWVQEHKN